ncbi:uncharacterized protein si:ch211-183d21.1 [Hoplias malabaricus]|uniref:uncharacterized protein si:ch211-183d21.1 n=1 Tax=Hoplias malabaricus TaxID=27720 RepID=UPI003462E78A
MAMPVSVTGALWVLCLCVQALQACLIISEVNCDNPSLDTREFVELYSLGGSSVSLDGYTLVFYNGNGNKAYRVIDLSGHHTDERGFFLVGSAELQPRPAVPLPPNSVQNGPDAIALYGPSWNHVVEGGNLSAVGLLDAIVYTSGKGNADQLAWVLTPGLSPYVEDDRALEGDESIQRCWLSDNLYTFQTGHPTPGRPSDCQPASFSFLHIFRIRLAGERPTELEVSGGFESGPLTAVLYDIRTDTVSTSVGFGHSQALPIVVKMNATPVSNPFELDGWALAVYEGPETDFPRNSPLSPLQPLDAFVFSGRTNSPSANLTETLIPGRKPFRNSSGFPEGDAYISRCGVANWTRDPGMFQLLPQRPGESSPCVWYNTCPYGQGNVSGTNEPFEPPSRSDNDFLLSEVNADSPGAAEDEEFVELWHPSGHRTSLNDIWLLLFNGNNGKIYREIELYGYYTDQQGYFLIGSDKLNPQFPIPANTIQNGPDAIAIYRSSSPPSSEGLGVPKRGLLDAIVYRARGSDRDSAELIQALTPGHLPLLEDSAALPGDESLSRCGPDRLNHISFRVASPTPQKENDCPHPPEGIVINEVGGVSGARGSLFVELTGPPLTSLNGLEIAFFGSDSASQVSLKGDIRQNRFYLLKNGSGADQSLPAVTGLRAVMLCFPLLGKVSVCGQNSQVQDLLVFSDDQNLHNVLHSSPQQTVRPVSRYDSISRCAMKGSTVWISSDSPTPNVQNICPSTAYSKPLDLCLQPDHRPFNCNVEVSAELLEQSCHCGLSSLHLKGVNLTCLSEELYVKGDVLAVSEQQRELMAQTLQSKHLPSCSISHERIYVKGSSLGLQVGLVLAVVLLLAVGGAIFFYLYRKKRPQDYYSMELNEPESPIEL